MKENLKNLIDSRPWLLEAKTAIEARFGYTNETCLILPTGTGKTVVTAGVLSGMKGAKILYLCPNDAIIRGHVEESFKNFGIKGMTFMTYPGFMQKSKLGDYNYFSRFDIVILDEFHRLGANRWGAEFNFIRDTVFRKNNTKILGLTATEKRYLDNGRDMAEELFRSDIAYKMSLSEAWKRNVYYAPHYVIANIDTIEDLTRLEQRISGVEETDEISKIKKEVEHLKNNWERTNGISGIIKENLYDEFDNNPNPKERQPLKRLIVFHETIEETASIMRQVQEYLSYAGYNNVRFYFANAGIDSCSQIRDSIQNISEDRLIKSSLKEVEAFNTLEEVDHFDGLKVMLSINMLNEGLHVKDCMAEIMFRSTASKNIFMQQIGRVMSPENTRKPVIIDLVKNIDLADNIIDLRPHESGRSRSNGEECKSEDPYNITVSSYVIDQVELEERFKAASDDSREKIHKFFLMARKGDFSFIGK